MAALRLHRIMPGLYQTGYVDTIDRDLKLGTLRAAGITMVINLARRVDEDLRSSTRIVRYYHLPIADGKDLPSMVGLDRLADLAADHIRAGRGGVLVQCQAGRNRSGLLNALIVRQLNGCTGAEAVAVVRAGRRSALVNPQFAAYLAGLPAPAMKETA